MSGKTFLVGTLLLGLLAYVAYCLLSIHGFSKEAGLSAVIFGSIWVGIVCGTEFVNLIFLSCCCVVFAVAVGAGVVIRVSLRHWDEWGSVVVVAIIFSYFLAWFFLSSFAWDIRRIIKKGKG